MTYGTVNIDAIATSSGQILGAGNSTAFKNRIINGGMVIDQRNGGATVSAVTNNVYLLDRYRYTASNSMSGKFNFAQNLNSVTPPVGFSYYSGFQTATTYSVSGSDLSVYEQIIEGYNISDLAFGTASAKAFTISFWVYSSLTGTFGGCLKNAGYSYSYPFTYSIPTANTWTYITINVTAPTGSSWNSTNGVGLRIMFGLGAGSTASGTANNTWQSADYYSATGAVSVVGTSGATFYITGVQLEVGTQATSFDFRDYGRELALCQRYYETFFGTAGAYIIIVFQAISGSNVTGGGSFKVTKRASASIALIGNVYINGYNNGGAGTAIISSYASSVDSWGALLTGASGLTAGNASGIYPANASSGFAFSAEL
jgi:hypothetical protein